MSSERMLYDMTRSRTPCASGVVSGGATHLRGAEPGVVEWGVSTSGSGARCEWPRPRLRPCRPMAVPSRMAAPARALRRCRGGVARRCERGGAAATRRRCGAECEAAGCRMAERMKSRLHVCVFVHGFLPTAQHACNRVRMSLSRGVRETGMRAWVRAAGRRAMYTEPAPVQLQGPRPGAEQVNPGSSKIMKDMVVTSAA